MGAQLAGFLDWNRHTRKGLAAATQPALGVFALGVYATLYLAGAPPGSASLATASFAAGAAALLLGLGGLGGDRRPMEVAGAALVLWVLPSACLLGWTGVPAGLAHAGFAIPFWVLASAKAAGMILLLLLPASVFAARQRSGHRWRAAAWLLAAAGIGVWLVETLWRGPEGVDELAFGLGFGALARLVRVGVRAWLALPLALVGCLVWAVPSVLFGLLYGDAVAAAIFSPLPLAPLLVPPLLLLAAAANFRRAVSSRKRAPQEIHPVPAHDPLDLGRAEASSQQRRQPLQLDH